MEKEETAAVGLATVASHPANRAQTHDREKRLRDELASQLAPEAMAAGQDRSLNEGVGEMLEEM